jgi:integral membrane protein
MDAIRPLRVVAALEGLSFVVLLFVAMPLKYAFGMPEFVRVVGALHGVLFVAFAAALFRATLEHAWPWSKALKMLLLTLIPFGAIPLERWLKREVPTTKA